MARGTPGARPGEPIHPRAAGHAAAPLGRRVLAGWLVCALTAWVWARLGGPLPFLLAPMLTLALSRAFDGPLAEWRHGRAMGQCVLGVGLGLRFTDEVVAGLVARWPWILLLAVLALLPAMVGYVVYRRWGRLSPVSACLCALPGGASEMALLAERHGASPAAVALTQGLRVALVVTVVPWGLMALGALPALPGGALPVGGRAAWPWTQWGLTLLWALAVAGPTAALHRRQWSNVWMMAPMCLTALVSVVGAQGGSPWTLQWPPGLMEGAQLLLGMTLGNRLDRQAWRAAPRLTVVGLGVVGLSLLGALAVSALAALGAPAVPHAWLTHMLSVAPGGMAEMALLARQSGAWLPEVITTHVVRLVLVLWLAPWLVRWVRHCHEN